MTHRTRTRRLAAASFATALLDLPPGLVHAAGLDAKIDATAESTLALDQAEPSEAVAVDQSAEVAQADGDTASVAFGASTNGSATVGLDEGGQLLALGASTMTTARIG